ncbi:MAG: GNAT family N-acetyltransferase [Cellulophaga sp.]|uniref:GNAT family N-acetyltransferase n=1 Tax=unclassified Cellulophaga TaxID=2634405 RepID=UPI000C2B8AE0|nr:GNAT family N-acetyltransferase [Cellulophaga sp. RHA19]PKB44131.1 hypothetical protein AX016_2345 [Cellulophaga sp. RHA19]
MKVIHNKENQKFTMDVEGATAFVDYKLKDGKMYLVYSEVPPSLRGKGVGKVLVEQTFELLTAQGYKAVAVCGYVKAIAKRSDKWNTIIEQA